MENVNSIGFIRKMKIKRTYRKIKKLINDIPKKHFAFNPPLLHLDVLNDPEKVINLTILQQMIDQIYCHLNMTPISIQVVIEKDAQKADIKVPIYMLENGDLQITIYAFCDPNQNSVLCNIDEDSFAALLCRELSRSFIYQKCHCYLNDYAAELCAVYLGIESSASFSNINIFLWNFDVKRRFRFTKINAMKPSEVRFLQALCHDLL